MFVKKIGLNEQPYGLGVDTLYVGLLQLPRAIVCSTRADCRHSCHKIWKSKIYHSRLYCPYNRTLSGTILSFNISRSCKYAYTICCRRIISDLVC